LGVWGLGSVLGFRECRRGVGRLEVGFGFGRAGFRFRFYARVWVLGLGAGCSVWGSGFGFWGLEFGVWGRVHPVTALSVSNPTPYEASDQLGQDEPASG